MDGQNGQVDGLAGRWSDGRQRECLKFNGMLFFFESAFVTRSMYVSTKTRAGA